MNNLLEVCKTKLDREQLMIGGNIEKALQLQDKKVHISYTNLNYAKGKGYTIRIYENNYDFRQYNLNYISGSTVEEYINCINYMDKDKSYILHRSTADERYLIDIAEALEVNYYIDSDFLYIGDDMENAIDVTEIKELHYIKGKLCVFITNEDEEKIKLDLAREEIIYLEEEDDNTEPLTIDFIKNVVAEFNKLNYWCNLVFKDNGIYILHKESNNLQELIDIDNIDVISLKDNVLFIGFSDEDENGFTSCLIDKHGIQY